jgi:hypothetical protein
VDHHHDAPCEPAQEDNTEAGTGFRYVDLTWRGDSDDRDRRSRDEAPDEDGEPRETQPVVRRVRPVERPGPGDLNRLIGLDDPRTSAERDVVRADGQARAARRDADRGIVVRLSEEEEAAPAAAIADPGDLRLADLELVGDVESFASRERSARGPRSPTPRTGGGAA